MDDSIWLHMHVDKNKIPLSGLICLVREKKSLLLTSSISHVCLGNNEERKGQVNGDLY